MVMFFNEDAKSIFLNKESVNFFFINPSYFESNLEEYDDSTENHINFVNSPQEYVNNLIPVVKHIEHALAKNGSAFIMLPNDEYNVIIDFCNMALRETSLKLGKIFIWDFSSTANIEDLESEKMGIIAHLHKGNFYVNKKKLEYVLKVPMTPNTLRKYENLGFVDNGLPVELYNKMIAAFSKPGDTVCDLFAGTGTIIESAVKLGRNFIYNDISQSQLEIAKARLKDLDVLH